MPNWLLLYFSFRTNVFYSQIKKNSKRMIRYSLPPTVREDLHIIDQIAVLITRLICRLLWIGVVGGALSVVTERKAKHRRMWSNPSFIEIWLTWIPPRLLQFLCIIYLDFERDARIFSGQGVHIMGPQLSNECKINNLFTFEFSTLPSNGY